MGQLVNDAGVTVFEGEIIGGDVLHKRIPVAYTDIDPTTGRAPIITLQPGEVMFASWRVVTEVFNDTAEAFNSTATLVVSGGSVGDNIDDTLSTQEISADSEVNGLIGPDPGKGPQGGTVIPMFPIVSPATVAVAIELDFCADLPTAGDGTAGALVQHLLILSAP